MAIHISAPLPKTLNTVSIIKYQVDKFGAIKIQSFSSEIDVSKETFNGGQIFQTKLKIPSGYQNELCSLPPNVKTKDAVGFVIDVIYKAPSKIAKTPDSFDAVVNKNLL